MTSPRRVTVALVDVPAFCARYGLHIARTGELDITGLPAWQWVADDGQTSEQAALVVKELMDGAKCQP